MIVTVGVDTHTDVHVSAVLDPAGRLLGTRSFPATTRGYAQLATWAESFGRDYVARRIAEGKTKTEIMRCLKRYIAREVFPLLTT